MNNTKLNRQAHYKIIGDFKNEIFIKKEKQTGFITTFFFISVLLTILLSPGIFAQISPGDLTTAHAKLEGLSNCTKCHELGKQVVASKCLKCHKEIQQLITDGVGYHASSEVKNKKCWNCHSEHHGKDFQIIHFDQKKFNHELTGFKLEGKHTQIKCFDCHKTKFITNKLFEKRKNTFLGLNTKCVSCHEDVHQNTLGNNCGSCHSTVKFKPAIIFNHDKAKFKLTGSHKKVECIKCHIKEKLNGKEFQKFTGLNFKNCTPCHRDMHKGKFGKNCASCHNDESFKILNKNSFNHDKTRFPLRGAHRNVKCSGCHGKNVLSKPKFVKCTDCHKDAHFGEFTVNKIVRDCKDCHNVDSFKVTIFTLADHNKIKFELTGAHLAVSCQSCHYKENTKQWHFKKIGMQCIDCHKNVHGSEIKEKFMPNNNCTSCHTTKDWKLISFDHNLTSFKLEGKHNSVKCKGCHESKTAENKIKFKFVSLKSNCKSCHHDIHFGQFDSEKKGNAQLCENCHGYDNWKPVKFDHEKTAFPLKGAHEKLLCSSCHKKVIKNGNEFIQYKLRDFKCASCHS